MALLNFRRRETATPVNGQLEAFLEGYSIEVMPRTAEKVEDFRELLPRGTRIKVLEARSNTLVVAEDPDPPAADG